MVDDANAWTVGRVASLAKVTVRTLHHYEEVGLLTPSGRSESGYRLYDTRDLERLQQILFFREVGLSLSEIRRIMLDPEFDRRAALRSQRAELADRARRTEAMLVAIDRALEAMDRGAEMMADDMFEVFGDFDPREYEEEARQRWGRTDAYAQSARRTAGYGKEDWRRIQAEGEEITAAFVAALDAGHAPGHAAPQAAAERHWRYLEKYFYTPTPEMYAGLGDLYMSDERFTRTIDAAREGLAAYQRDAMHAYAAERRAG